MFSVSRRFLPILFCMEEMDFIGWTRYAKVALEPFTNYYSKKTRWDLYVRTLPSRHSEWHWEEFLVVIVSYLQYLNWTTKWSKILKKTVTITRVMLEHLINGNKCGWWGRMLSTSWDSLHCFVRPSKQVLFSTPLIT